MLLLFWNGATATLGLLDQEAVYTFSVLNQNRAVYRVVPEGSTTIRYGAHETQDGVQYVSKPSGRGVS